MVIFSHRGIGFGKRDNSLVALSAAVRRGFSVEVDLRLSNNSIVLSHDAIDTENQELNGLLKLLKGNPNIFFALHLKEDSRVLFKKVGDSIKTFKNCFLFVTDFKQDNFIIDIFDVVGKDRLALYVTDKDLDSNLANKISYLWLDETRDDIYKGLDYFIRFGKKIILCAPEVFSDKKIEQVTKFKELLERNQKDIFGICTDFCLNYAHYSDVFR